MCLEGVRLQKIIRNALQRVYLISGQHKRWFLVVAAGLVAAPGDR